MVQLLHKHGWDINRTDEYGRGAVHRMILHEEIVRWLVDNGATLEFEAHEEIGRPNNLLTWCARHGNLATMRYLQSKGANIGPTVLHQAVFRSACFGADPAADPAHSDTGKEKQVENRLQARIHEGIAILDYLIDELKLDINQHAGVNIQHVSYMPLTWIEGPPINVAAVCEKGAKVVSWLLQKGADPNSAADFPAYEYARVIGAKECAAVLKQWADDKAAEEAGGGLADQTI